MDRITYDLCHLYTRADNTVSYATPAYFAETYPRIGIPDSVTSLPLTMRPVGTVTYI